MNELKTVTDKQMKVWDYYYKQGTTPWTADIALQDLSYQIGSLAKLNLQLKNCRYRDGQDDEMIKAKMADELVDIVAEALFIAREMDIDMDKAFHDMLLSDIKKITTRNPDVEITL